VIRLSHTLPSWSHTTHCGLISDAHCCPKAHVTSYIFPLGSLGLNLEWSLMTVSAQMASHLSSHVTLLPLLDSVTISIYAILALLT
jgi:hypothetical protein